MGAVVRVSAPVPNVALPSVDEPPWRPSAGGGMGGAAGRITSSWAAAMIDAVLTASSDGSPSEQAADATSANARA